MTKDRIDDMGELTRDIVTSQRWTPSEAAGVLLEIFTREQLASMTPDRRWSALNHIVDERARRGHRRPDDVDVVARLLAGDADKIHHEPTGPPDPIEPDGPPGLTIMDTVTQPNKKK